MDDVRHPDAPARDTAQDSQSRDTGGDAPPKRGRATAFIALALAILLLGGGGVLYWLSVRGTESTDDAAIDGHVSQVSPQVAGRVVGILINDNQVVAQGQVLVRIDPRDFQVRLDQAVAQRAQAAAELAQARATLGVRHADVAQAEANIHVAEADLTQAQQDLARYRAINPNAITRQQLDNATAAQRGAQARLEANRQAAESLRAQLAVAEAQVVAAEAVLQTDDANVAGEQLQLSYTQVVAPAPGRVTRRTVELGNYVNAGQPLLAIVQPGLWVTANFKETQLTRMRPGQHVRIYVDAFPDATLDGHVDSLQSGTGSVFSAMPVENATGNYVKVVQRLPVKILFDGLDAEKLPLAPGMSVIPRVYLH
jgi:membrane fusion protein (multidrug efflux system)